MSASDLKILYETSAFEIHEGANLIGRKDADITIPVSSLSKEHARIIRMGSRVEIEDAGSKNGTLLNDEPVQGRMPLGAGDVIVLGGKVELRVVSGDAPAPKSGRALVAPGLDDSKRSADAPPRRASPESAADAPPAAKAKFTVVAGDGKGKVVTVAADKQFTLGTKEENGLALKGEGISRYHAEVVFEKGVWLLKDLGSRNGTFVRERKVDLHELANGDVVQIGSVHLRFDAEEARAPGDPRDLVALVKQDPKAALKSPHMRRALMLLVGALCCAYLAFGRGKKDADTTVAPTNPAEARETIHQTIEFLRKDEAARADGLIGKSIRALGPYKQNVTLNNLEKVVKKWLDHKSPLTFEWSEAVEAIDGLIRGSSPAEMDQDCVDWLQKARTETQSEIPNAELRKQADILMTRGQNELRAGKKEGADTLREAREAFSKMPPSSVFAASARERAELIRKQLLDHFKREAETRIPPAEPSKWEDWFRERKARAQGDPAFNPLPQWDEAQKIFGDARKFTETLDERRPIDERTGFCEINRNDQKTLEEVADIVRFGKEQLYGKAKDLIETIGERSFYYRAAHAYLSWFHADGLARQAINAYHQGQLDNARRLIEQAVKQPDLEAGVIQSAKVLVDRWVKVEASLRLGFEAEKAGDAARAKELFREVLDLEPTRENVFRQRADKELAILENREQEDLDGALKSGIEMLDGEKFSDAYEKFCFVLERAQNPGPPRTQIEDAVARVNAEKGLFKRVKDIVVHNNKAKFPVAREILQLLGRFLPEKSPDRQPAIDLLPKVKG